MMIDKTKLAVFHQATGIPLTVCGLDGQVIFALGCFEPNPAWQYVKHMTGLPRACATTTPSNLFCGLLRCGEETVLLGPVAPYDSTSKQIKEVLRELEQPINRSEHLMRWLQQIPRHTDRRFRSAIEMLNAFLTDELSCEVVRVPYHQDAGLPEVRAEPQGLSLSFIPAIENALERHILGCVEYGRAQELEVTLDELLASRNIGLPDFNLDSARTYQNIYVLSVSLVSRSAAQGGMSYSASSELATKYLSQVRTIETPASFDMLWRAMLLEFTHAVARFRRLKTDSILVTRICKDVQTNIFDKIQVRDIAVRLGRSEEYLCRHFKLKTGQTIIQYVQGEKVVECKRMLSTTNLSLSEIAAHLAFSSQNYMHAVFLKHMGITPAAYRNASLYSGE